MISQIINQNYEPIGSGTEIGTDPDDDNDGVIDMLDAFPLDPTQS